MICIETSAVIFTLRFVFLFSYKLKLSLIQRHNLHNLCVYIPLLENRKIIRHIFEEFNAKFQYRTLVQGK